MAFTRDTFVIYDKQFQGGLWERMTQNVNAFNGASANGIQLSSDSLQGDYERRTYFDALNEDAIARRDPNSMSEATSYDLTQSELISVNLLRRIGPVDKTLEAWYQIAKSPEQLSVLVGQMVGDLKSKKMLNTALTALTAGISGQTNLVYDATALGSGSTKTLITDHLVKGMAKMGDAWERLVCWVMHSKPYFDLVQNQVSDKMDTVAGVIVYGASPATFNKPVVVTDSTALVNLNGSATDTYNVLGLVSGACAIKDSAQSSMVSDVITGKDNLLGRIQGEFALNLGVKGFAWDTTDGGANPTDAALGTSTNWDQVATSDKDLAGVLIEVE